MNYRIGLYLDNDKIGWAAIRENEEGHAEHIERVGVRFFPIAENSFNGSTPGSERRMYRLARRRYTRQKYRFAKLRELFSEVGLPPMNTLVHKPVDYLWQLRTDGLDRQLSAEEWVRVLYHIAHHRGFQPGTGEQLSETFSNNAKIRKAIHKNQQRMDEQNYRTVGELFYRDSRFRPNGLFSPFKTGIPYITSVSRDMIREEVVLLFYTQRILGNPFATEVFEQKYTEILCRQRFILSGPGPNSPYAGHKRRFGGIYCPPEPRRERCPDATPLAERFRFLCMVNAPYSIPPHTQPIAKTEEQKRQIRAAATKNPAQLYAATNNVLNLDPKTPLTLYLDGIPYSAASMNNWIIPHGRRLLSALSKKFPDEQGILHKHWEDLLLLFVSTPEKYWKQRLKEFHFSKELCDLLAKAHLVQRARYSRKALGRIVPLMEKGMSMEEARDKCYPDSPVSNTSTKLNFKNFYHVARPATDRTLSQAIVLIKALLREYGMPTHIRISTSYEMGKPLSLRKKHKKIQENRDKKLAPLFQTASGFLQRSLTSDECTRIILWSLQNHACMYTGTMLTFAQALSSTDTAVDHIIPYSDCYDHSYNNLVLVLRSASNHRNHLPGVTFGRDIRYRNRASERSNRKCRINLLASQWTEQDSINQRQRSLSNPSPLLTGFALFLQRTLSAQDNILSSVTPVNTGTIGLRLSRVFEQVPPAMDSAGQAILTALSEPHTCEQLSDFFANDYEGTLFQPWPSFHEEFSALCSPESSCFSHMAQHKVRGAAHRDTLMRRRGDEIVAKRALIQLKLDANNEIADYFQPERDRLLYSALRNQLIAHNGNAAEAFAEPFYKPKANGDIGPLVKSVPIIQHPRAFVSVRGGIGTHGDMIRIDVFRTSNNEYYYVPIYVKDTLQPTLSLRAVTKNPNRMLLMSESDFIFSLYSNDVIYIELPDTITLKSVSSNDTINVNHGYFLRGNVKIKSGTFEVSTLDKQYIRTSIPFYSLRSLYKCEVDPLGKIRKITSPEKRMTFHLK